MIIKTDQSEIQNFLSDAANYRGNCSAVYFPKNEKDIIEILDFANREKCPITIAGNGTGLTGARVPEGGIVISTEKMNKVLEVNTVGKYAVVEPGVILRNFQEIITKENLYYPPDPTELDCFIGANVATNASGARTFKYGSTRDFVLELEVILPTGKKLNLIRGNSIAENYKLDLLTSEGQAIKIRVPNYLMPKTKNTAGYYCKMDMDAIDLFIGSEGTLGIITKIKLRLLDKPQKIISCIVFFDDENSALNFISKVIDRSYNTRNEKIIDIDAVGVEFFDGFSLKFLSKDYPNIPQMAKSAVWFEQELYSDVEEVIFSKWFELIAETGGDKESAWYAVNDSDREKFKNFRHAISYKINEYITRKKMQKVGTDIAVPNKYFKELYYFSKKLVENQGIEYVIYGHFGDSHIHLNMLPKNEEEFQNAKEIYSGLCKKAVSLEGTISAEHGIGKLKRDYLLIMYGEDIIRKMASLKVNLDPNKIFGRGNIFDTKYLDTIS